MNTNICHFIPFHSDYNSIHTINLVYETEHKISKSLQSQGLYRVHYICSGFGKLHLPGRELNLTNGDILFTFPDSSYYIEPTSDDFSYMYISYIGTRANMIMEKMRISRENFIIAECYEVKDFWEKAISADSDVSEWMAESVLLYTFSYLYTKSNIKTDEKKIKSSLPDMIKKYIDDNFTDERMSLKFLSESLSYSPKYISAIFKKHFGAGVAEYITTIRIQHAMNLISQGFSAISDIAAQCGYSSAQYFSKVFRQKCGMSAKEFMKSKIA